MTTDTAGRILVLCVLCAGIAAAVVWRDSISIENLTTWVAQAGWIAPLAFIAGYAVATVFFLPGLVFTLAGGALVAEDRVVHLAAFNLGSGNKMSGRYSRPVVY